MTATFHFEWTNPAFEDLPAAIAAGLEAGGVGWHQALGGYPPQTAEAAAHYQRTMHLADKAAYKVNGGGAGHYTMDVGGIYYSGYVLNGTEKWEGWPGKLDAAKSLVTRAFVAAFKRILRK